MPTRVRFRREVLRERQVSREPGLGGGQLASLHEQRQDLRRRRLQEAERHLLAGDLRENVVPALDAASGVLGQAARGEADHCRSEGHVRRGLDATDPAPQIEVGDGLLERGLARAVDQVGAPGKGARIELTLELVHGGLDPGQRKASRAEEAQEPVPRHLRHEPGGGDAVGHGAGGVREANPVDLAERAIPQPLRVERRQGGHQRPGSGGPVRAASDHLAAKAQAEPPVPTFLDDVGRGSHVLDRTRQITRAEGRASIGLAPVAQSAGRLHRKGPLSGLWHREAFCTGAQLYPRSRENAIAPA